MPTAVRLPKKDIVLPQGKVVPYGEVQDALKSGDFAWVEGLHRSTAHKAASVLSRRMKKEVRQTNYKHQGKKGYLFYIVS